MVIKKLAGKAKTHEVGKEMKDEDTLRKLGSLRKGDGGWN